MANYGLTTVSGPAVEPLTVLEAKGFARIDLGEDDPVLTYLITAARERCERVAGRALITQTLKLTLDSFFDTDTGLVYWDGCYPGWVIQLPQPPLQSVTTVKYYDTTGTQQTLASTEYQVLTTSEPGRICPAYGKIWPTNRVQREAIEITYVAGYGTTSASVPGEIRARLAAYVSYCYENRMEPDEAYLDSLFERMWTGKR